MMEFTLFVTCIFS